MMADMDRAVETLIRLKDLGVRLAIDDFGTGYSSLAYLKRFPLDTLKIDRSFVHDLTAGSTDAAIIDAIIALGHCLGFTLVAEGVETVEQATILFQRRCHCAQGYLLGRPMPAEAFADLLSAPPPPAPPWIRSREAPAMPTQSLRGSSGLS
jgi:EAL domain-containing protein (putative c-di-GMP-specific phosphodiesterase class I)